jgi:diaminohydroxyphosphoribosylaminopyrimidine deaminase/5-amino-6-(5-phosphoribosylamino)uracil reductase
VDAIVRAGISRVVAAMRDPFPKVAGGGFARLEEAGVRVEVGLEELAARGLNAAYLKRVTTGRPYVTAKWAMTLDGKTAVKGGHSQWISGARSRALVHELRGRVDGILVGLGTVLQDDPRLTARPEGPRVAARVVLDSEARLPLGSQLARTAREVPVVVASTRRGESGRVEGLRRAGCEVLVFETGGPVPVGPLLDNLGARGWTNLLVEGGGRVLGSFLDAGEVDEVEVYLAPVIEGGDHARSAVRGSGVDSMDRALRLIETEVQVLEGDVRLRGVLPKPWREPSGAR